MRALVVDGPGRVRVDDVPWPTVLEPTDAIVDVAAAGICGTDTHAVAHAGVDLPDGTVIGHEFVGSVIEIGGAVTTLAVGDRVLGADFCACGRCAACRRRDHWHCPERRFFGTGTAYGPALPGGLAERVRVPHAETTLGRLPSTVPDDLAVLATDTLATAVTAVDRARVHAGTVVAVVGAGPVGQLTGMVARAAGASAVLVSEPSPERRAEAEALGLVAVEPDALVDAGQALTGGRGVDAAIEAVGLTTSLGSATAVVRGGGTVVVVGVPADETAELLLGDLFRREVDLRFVIGDPIRERDRLLTMLETRQFDPGVVLGPPASLDEAADDFDRFARGQRRKVVVTP